MHRALVASCVLLPVVVLTAACGGGSSAAGNDSSSSDVKTIDVTFSGDTVTPSGDRVEVSVDQPIQLVVEADQAGEIHVHSEPEQELAYDAGTTTLDLRIDRPGIVEVESHSLDQVIVQLEVK